MVNNEKLMHIIEHRLHSIDVLIFALKLRSQWEIVPSISVYIDKKLKIEGSLNAITNPMIEIGLVHCRAILEFLGICARDGSLKQISKRQVDDIGNENFAGPCGVLVKVDPTKALKRYDGPQAEAQNALLKVFHLTNKGIAHSTTDLLDDPEDAHLVEIAGRGLIALMISYFYTPLGLAPPVSRIATRFGKEQANHESSA